ncbi:hypothetical protein GQ53DRAFT_847261 [Thozetella sp. PMI_491]|nr:hypothetical protein GQ53DRAFT_847261 [Thozetella sp. PMI_491]
MARRSWIRRCGRKVRGMMSRFRGRTRARDAPGEPRGSSNATVTKHPAPKPAAQDGMAARMVRDPQSQSQFFSKLPVELRRHIYREVWAGYLGRRSLSASSPGSDLRLHIHEIEGNGQGRLGHTVCLVDPDAPAAADPQVIQPWPSWPFSNGGNHPVPPLLFWWSWCLRLRWGKHWKCQERVMLRWDPHTGKTTAPERSPFLPVFLTCRKMHEEAIESFFETVTPIFTSSGDSWQFFIQNPHASLDRLRSLALEFSHPNDHLYLHRFLADPTAAGASPRVGDLLSYQLWVELLRGIRAKATGLRDLEITVGARMQDESEDLLGMFKATGAHGLGDEEAAPESGDGEQEQAEQAEQAEQDEQAMELEGHEEPMWQLPGKLRVDFSVKNTRFTQTNEGKMVEASLS